MKSLTIENKQVEIWRDTSEVSARAAEVFVQMAKECIATNGSFTVALSGGSTPKALYELLAQERRSSQIDWSRTHIFWSDERCVPPDSGESNYRTSHEALLKHVAVPATQIHRMRGEDEPEKAANDYEKALVDHFGAGSEPRFDLILLGMGDDGHTASLFSATTAIEEKEKWIAAPFVEKFAAHRLTFTFKTINAAARIVFLVTGASKTETLRAVLEDGPQKHFPASLVKPMNGELIWLVDEAAASAIASTNYPF
jgi:6-phosphogluconolactonase